MKSSLVFSVFIIGLIFSSCNSIDNDELYDARWQLEYISGPRIAFDGLYPDKKPVISFDKASKKVEGNNSCNGYSAEFKIDGNAISFGEPGPTTMMFCGNGENVFLSTIKKVNNFSIEDGKLKLNIDDVTMMRFHKIDP